MRVYLICGPSSLAEEVYTAFIGGQTFTIYMTPWKQCSFPDTYAPKYNLTQESLENIYAEILSLPPSINSVVILGWTRHEEKEFFYDKPGITTSSIRVFSGRGELPSPLDQTRTDFLIMTEDRFEQLMQAYPQYTGYTKIL